MDIKYILYIANQAFYSNFVPIQVCSTFCGRSVYRNMIAWKTIMSKLRENLQNVSLLVMFHLYTKETENFKKLLHIWPKRLNDYSYGRIVPLGDLATLKRGQHSLKKVIRTKKYLD